MEFSTDPATAGANHLLTEKFLVEVHDALIENELETTFGLIATKEHSSSDYQFVEFNTEHSSILKEVTEVEVHGKSLIQTSWSFSPGEIGNSCQASCFSQCVVPASGGAHYHQHPKAHQP